jgi:cold-inducible RNA-binding protein
MKIFIARLPYEFQEAEIAELFAPYGEVSSANLIMDRDTGRSKGYAFVEMPDDTEAQNAIDNLNEKQILNKSIAVSEARQKTEKPGGFNKGNKGGNNGGYRGGSGSGGNYRDKGNGGGNNRDRDYNKRSSEY